MERLTKRNLVIIFTASVICGIILILIFSQNDDKDTKTNSVQLNNLNSEASRVQSFEFPNSPYYVRLTTSVDGKQSLVMHNREENYSKKLTIFDSDYKYKDFTWDQDKTKLYFISKIPESAQINFLYININDYDPYAVTEIVYEDPEDVLNDQTKLIGVKDNILYLETNNKVYTLDPSQGVDTRPVKSQ